MCRLELSRNCEGEHCSVLVTAWRVSGKGFLKSECLPCRPLRSTLISWQLNKSQNIYLVHHLCDTATTSRSHSPKKKAQTKFRKLKSKPKDSPTATPPTS